VAVIAAILQVILAVKNKTSNFIFGIISVLCYVVLFFQYQLYADAALNVYYFGISIYGLYAWQDKNDNTLKISRTRKNEWIIPMAILTIGFAVIYIVQIKFTKNTFALSDSLVAAFAWCGTYLMTRRKIENWILLNISNVIAIPLYYQKQLVVTTGLTVVLFIMAIIGFLKWQNKLEK
jgi:nicotinamide mononucleotide transporter